MTGRRMEPAAWIALVLMVLVALVAVFAVISFQDAAPKADEPSKPGPTESAGASGGAGGPAAVPPDCPAATATVATAAELTAALAAPQPGAVILLADGVYVGNFVGTGAGTSDQPVTLCGGRGAVLDGGGQEEGYVLHLDRASYWTVQGFTVRNGQKGVMLDETTQSVIQGLLVEGIGDEAIHLRRFSSDNRVAGNTVTGAGLRKPKFGEGIYVGTAESNWCNISSCEPDKSDRNEISDNIISGTTAESVDIKEGTSDGVLSGNNFEGSSIREADSWVDVKGKGWRIERNSGKNSPLDGFQTHEILDGWGTGNVFRENTAEVNGPGLGYSLKPVRDNVVDCSNTASHAEQGLSNLPCTN
ncbi:right-handed parallel beta-helix repeat-containing protein [Pseudarthrobacter sulfonivorans]|uniref:right-handed parallel beta-helix repeat-containing protein n=1 Tax=Pseudarthrobacter sulfonivorans TaxID=121292 RepID=UPI00278B262E|nr:DUF1565 domain-containing protein [Pseudarthrobacter sulfonivorans]MDP9998805.1 hypothetical protein [Pseudarthrobacter sulfonivorans]